MNIYINGNPVAVNDELLLETFLFHQNLADKKGIAVAVNNQVVNKTYWSTHVLRESDKILIIKASQGG